MKKLFNVSSSDWTKNPAMIIVDGVKLKPNYDIPTARMPDNLRSASLILNSRTGL
jgi:hypothetical protein